MAHRTVCSLHTACERTTTHNQLRPARQSLAHMVHFSAAIRCIGGLVVEYIVAINVTRVRFPADAFPVFVSKWVGPPRRWDMLWTLCARECLTQTPAAKQTARDHKALRASVAMLLANVCRSNVRGGVRTC